MGSKEWVIATSGMSMLVESADCVMFVIALARTVVLACIYLNSPTGPVGTR